MFGMDMFAATTAQPEHARSAHLLNLILAAIVALGVLFVLLPALFGMNEGWIGESISIFGLVLVISGLLYLINQRYSYQLAAILFIAFLIIITTISSYPNYALWELDTLMYLVIPVLISSAFLSLRATLVTMFVTLLMPLVMAAAVPTVPLIDILSAPFAFLLAVNTLIIAVAHHRDRLERCRQRQLAESERLLRLITENIEEAILFIDSQGIIQFASPSYEKLLGESVPELTGLSILSEPFISRTHPDDRAALTAFAQASQALMPNRLQTRLLHADGSYIWVETHINRAVEKDGELLGVIAVSRDISDRKQAEAALRDSVVQFRRLFAANPLPMWVYDIKTLAFLDVNDAAIEKYGYSRDEFLSMRITEIRPPQDITRLMTVLNDDSSRPIYGGEWRHTIKSGQVIDVEISGHEIEYIGQRAMLIVSQDITARKQAEADAREREKLAGALAKERELGEIRNLFMRTVSHEFRTPLAAILSSTDMIDTYADRVSPERRAESAETIRREVARLEKMLGDVTAILKIQDQHLALEVTPLNLEAFFRALVDEFRQTSPEHPVDLRLHITEEKVGGDARLLRYITGNLLSNAAKYSPPACPVEVQVEQTNSGIHLQVRDQGIGIEPDDQPRLFEAFYRGSNVNQISGTGLGLKIVHDCVQLYRGSITFESDPGVGTTFYVTLPVL